MTILITLLLILLGGAVQADTTWVTPGVISGVWTEDGSPYMISAGDVTVPTDSALFITEGVIVHFTGPYAFYVSGALVAVGTEADSIYFRSDPEETPGGWRGLRFLSCQGGCELSYCVIERGRASGAGSLRYGGGVECQDSDPHFLDCTIQNNSAIIDGGGIYAREGSDPIFERCVIRNNTASAGGGGLLSRAASDPVLHDCMIAENTAATGGGVQCGGTSDMELEACRILDNHANLGGGFYCDFVTATPSLTHCLIAGNIADSSGGGAYLRDTDAVIRYSVVYGNSSPSAGGLHVESASGSIRNTIIAFSQEGSGLRFVDSPSVTIESCDISDHPGGLFTGSGPAGFGELARQNLNYDSCDVDLNIFLDPEFADAGLGDFHLTENSPCVAAGTPSAGLPNDPDGTPRPSPEMTLPDHGIYEHAAGSPMQVCGALSGELGPGVYAVTCDLQVGHGEVLNILAGTTLLFAGDYSFTVEGTLTARGQEDGPILMTRYFDVPGTFWGGLEFVSSRECRLENTTIEYAHMPEDADRPDGGGIYLDDSSPEFDQCTIRWSEAQADGAEGGGVYCGNGSSPDLFKCVILGNSADLKGGGLSVDETSTVSLTSCTVAENTCGLFGGGVYLHQSASSFVSCEIAGNLSGTRGGGVYSWWSTPLFDRCTIVGNSCNDLGGGVFANSSAPQFQNCTISGNGAAVGGGGLLLFQTAARVKNSIVVYSSGGGIRFDQNNTFASVEYNDVFGNLPEDLVGLENAPGQLGAVLTTNFNGDSCDLYFNISLDPQFVDTAEGNYGIAASSACINAGDPSTGLDADSSLADLGAQAASLAYVPSTPFNLLLPPDGQGVDENDLLLTWERSFDEGTVAAVPLYRMQISDDSNLVTDLFELTATDTSLLIAGLEDSTTYWWRVLAIGSNGIARSSNQKRSVYTVVPHVPSPFALLQPEDGDTILTTQSRLFCWERSEDLDGGDFVLYALKLQGVDTLLVFSDLTDTCLNIVPVVLGLSQEGNVEWWVEASSHLPDTTVECEERFHFFLDDPNVSVGQGSSLPREFALHSAFPNPFNGSTTLGYDLPIESDVTLRVVNVLGQEVAVLVSDRVAAGSHRVIWEANELPSGIYSAVYEAGGVHGQVRKLMLLK